MFKNFFINRKNCKDLYYFKEGNDENETYLLISKRAIVSRESRSATVIVGVGKETSHILGPVFKTLSVQKGYAHMWKSSSGDFIKMVHNEIE